MSEPMWVSALRIALLVAFAAALLAISPALWFSVSNPGALWPPGMPYRVARISGIRHYRERDRGGVVRMMYSVADTTRSQGFTWSSRTPDPAGE